MSLLQVEYIFTLKLNYGDGICCTWGFLVTCFTVSVSNNLDLVSNIKMCLVENTKCIFMNGGSQLYNETADLKLLSMKCHVNAYLMATILSMKDTASIERVRWTMDT